MTPPTFVVFLIGVGFGFVVPLLVLTTWAVLFSGEVPEWRPSVYLCGVVAGAALLAALWFGGQAR